MIKLELKANFHPGGSFWRLLWRSRTKTLDTIFLFWGASWMACGFTVEGVRFLCRVRHVVVGTAPSGLPCDDTRESNRWGSKLINLASERERVCAMESTHVLYSMWYECVRAWALLHVKLYFPTTCRGAPAESVGVLCLAWQDVGKA